MAQNQVRLSHKCIAPNLEAAMEASVSAAGKTAAVEPLFDVLIALQPRKNDPKGGVPASRKAVLAEIKERFPGLATDSTQFFIQFKGTSEQVHSIADTIDGVEMVWLNETVTHHIVVSAETVRASAGWRTFVARGKGITWAVLDTGI